MADVVVSWKPYDPRFTVVTAAVVGVVLIIVVYVLTRLIVSLVPHDSNAAWATDLVVWVLSAVLVVPIVGLYVVSRLREESGTESVLILSSDAGRIDLEAIVLSVLRSENLVLEEVARGTSEEMRVVKYNLPQLHGFVRVLRSEVVGKITVGPRTIVNGWAMDKLKQRIKAEFDAALKSDQGSAAASEP